MQIELKNNLMEDAERAAAMEAFRAHVTSSAEVLASIQQESAKLARGLKKLPAALDAHDAAVDAMGVAANAAARERTDASRRAARKATALVQRLHQRVVELQTQIDECRGKLLQLTPRVQQDAGSFYTAMQAYQFSLQAPAPLPVRQAPRTE